VVRGGEQRTVVNERSGANSLKSEEFQERILLWVKEGMNIATLELKEVGISGSTVRERSRESGCKITKKGTKAGRGTNGKGVLMAWP